MAAYILINFGSGDGFLADSTKPLPELISQGDHQKYM